MIARLNHVAVAVKDLKEAIALYRDGFGARVSEPVAQPDQGVSVAFVELDNTRIELLEPFGEASPIAAFMQRHPEGGLHHLCYETPDILAARDAFLRRGGRALGDGEPKMGAKGKMVLFLHPKDCLGSLIELEQA